MKFSIDNIFPKKTFLQKFDVIVDGEHHEIELDFCEFNKYLERSYAFKELLLNLFYIFMVIVSAIIIIIKFCFEYGVIE